MSHYATDDTGERRGEANVSSETVPPRREREREGIPPPTRRLRAHPEPPGEVLGWEKEEAPDATGRGGGYRRLKSPLRPRRRLQPAEARAHLDEGEERERERESAQSWWQKTRKDGASPSINKSARRLQTNGLPIKVVTAVNCDAKGCSIQPSGGGEGDVPTGGRGGGERGRGATLPCGCALPHIADAALERLGGVPEGAHAAVPVAFVRRLFGMSFWP